MRSDDTCGLAKRAAGSVEALCGAAAITVATATTRQRTARRTARGELDQCSENALVRPYTGADSACQTECMCGSASLVFTRSESAWLTRGGAGFGSAADGLNDSSAPS